MASFSPDQAIKFFGEVKMNTQQTQKTRRKLNAFDIIIIVLLLAVAGAVIYFGVTGGGALFPRTAEIFQQTFEFPVRTGYPYDVEHNLGELANPRYSTVWGTLKFAEEQLKLMLQNRRQGMWATLSGAVGNVGESAWRTLAGLKNSIKI